MLLVLNRLRKSFHNAWTMVLGSNALVTMLPDEAASEQLATTLKDLKLSEDQRREIAAKAFENASARAKEFAEMTISANREMFETAKQRMTDNFAQIRSMFPQKS